jgi:formylglycine-generating enzyme required for sulfatase activity
MKQFYLIIVGCLLFLSQAFANNLVISGTPSYTDATKILRFNIQWDNSWSINSGPANWDGVWIFVKRQNCSGTNNWVHQKLSTTSADHSAKIGANASTDVQVDAVTDGMGVFIRRIGTVASPNVVGNVPVQTVYLKLDGSATGTNPSSTMTAADNFEVLGIEMVYVPQGPFYAGDGRNPNTSNFSNGTATTPYLVDASKQASGAGQATNYTNNVTYGSPVPLPATFPLGFNGFYCMKYEATVGIFVEFLNSLTYDQQTSILQEAGVSNLPNVISSWFDYPNTWGFWNRVTTVGVYNTVPAVFSAPYLYLAEGGVVWRSMTAFLDWSGLRPMTEFEYEKACRGSTGTAAIAAVANEYPWGTTTISNQQVASDYTNVNSQLGSNVEGPAFYTGWDGSAQRPGAFARTTTNRTQSGATYYGIMDMAGNCWEQCVGGGGYDYSGFTSANGDGAISTTGRANVTGWPANGGVASGTIIRGGWWEIGGNTFRCQTSDRSFFGGYQWNGDKSNAAAAKYNGARGVRNFSY